MSSAWQRTSQCFRSLHCNPIIRKHLCFSPNGQGRLQGRALQSTRVIDTCNQHPYGFLLKTCRFLFRLPYFRAPVSFIFGTRLRLTGNPLCTNVPHHLSLPQLLVAKFLDQKKKKRLSDSASARHPSRLKHWVIVIFDFVTVNVVEALISVVKPWTPCTIKTLLFMPRCDVEMKPRHAVLRVHIVSL